MTDALSYYDQCKWEQYRTNSDLVGPLRSLAHLGKVQVPKEPKSTEPSQEVGQSGQVTEQNFLNHPLMEDSPYFSQADTNNTHLVNEIPLDDIEELLEGDRLAPQLKLELENKLRQQKQLKQRLSANLYSAPTFKR